MAVDETELVTRPGPVVMLITYMYDESVLSWISSNLVPSSLLMSTSRGKLFHVHEITSSTVTKSGGHDICMHDDLCVPGHESPATNSAHW